MRKVRKKIKTVSKELQSIQVFLRTLPDPLQEDVKKELQKAFELGCVFSELQHLPHTPPLDGDGTLKLGPALRYHILETRKVYSEVWKLRSVVEDIFNEKSEVILRGILRENQEVTSGTEVTEISVGE